MNIIEMKRDELIQMCKDRKMKGYAKMNKEELIKLLNLNSNSNDTRMTVADFFCGAGGFSEGFYQEGFDVVFALDYWKPAYITHEHNHKHCKTVCMNILEIDTPEKIDAIIPDTDIIIGSPPCISFSNSNLAGKADKTLGLQLINQYLKIVQYKKNKPNSQLKYWIMENVPNSIDYIKSQYTSLELGLDPLWPDLIINNKNILIASNYGSPQGRKRAIVGDYILPVITHANNPIHINTILQGLGPPLNNPKDVIGDPSFPVLTLRKDDLTDHFYDSEIPSEWTDKAQRLKVDHGFMGKMDFPDRTNRLCRTIMATESYCSRESIIFPKEGHPGKYRAPTIRELACLMGFPIDYQFIGTNSNSKHKQIGNAVCVHLSMALARAIKQNKTFEVKPRILVKANVNLNDLQTPLFSKYKVNPKKLNSKFHIHVPYLKVNQSRVELNNVDSDFENNVFKWNCILHKGSGKKTLKTQFGNLNLVDVIANHKHYKEINKFIEEMKLQVYDSYKFQEKNCNINTGMPHYAPYELLQYISNKIKALNMKDDTVEVPELDVIFNCNNIFSMEIIYSLYILNAVVANLK